MYKIIIADDEPWVAYKLLHLPDWQRYGFEVIDTAGDGMAAYQACMDKKPDVLLTDIRMPGKDGLQLTEDLRRDLPGIQVVLISGHAEFIYAQKAVKLGAFDYLVKPVTREQLEEMLARLKVKLADSSRQLDSYFSLLDFDRSMTASQWLSIRQPGQSHAYFRCCTFQIGQGEYPELLYEHLTPEYSQIIIRTGKNKAFALLGGADEKSLGHWKNPTDYCGYSEPGDAQALFETLHRHSDMAFQTARFLNAGVPVTYMKRHDEAYVSQLTADIEKALSLKAYQQCEKLLAALEKLLAAMTLNQIEAILMRVYHAFAANRLLPPMDDEAGDDRYFSTAYRSLFEVFELLKDSMAQKETADEFPLALITQYIDAHFTQELLVSDLAKRFHFSSGYFSAMFSKGMAQTVTKYIADKRMGYAKKLLIQTELSIQAVADRSGYGDYFQFTKAFKRINGMTPGQYRKTKDV